MAQGVSPGKRGVLQTSPGRGAIPEGDGEESQGQRPWEANPLGNGDSEGVALPTDPRATPTGSVLLGVLIKPGALPPAVMGSPFGAKADECRMGCQKGRLVSKMLVLERTVPGEIGWEAGIRTPIGGSRVRSLTVRRPPNPVGRGSSPQPLVV